MRDVIEMQKEILKTFHTFQPHILAALCRKYRGIDLFHEMLKYEKKMMKNEHKLFIEKYAAKLPPIELDNTITDDVIDEDARWNR
jgi:aminoglycoside/choline kinase family phosphotransferase